MTRSLQKPRAPVHVGEHVARQGEAAREGHAIDGEQRALQHQRAHRGACGEPGGGATADGTAVEDDVTSGASRDLVET